MKNGSRRRTCRRRVPGMPVVSVQVAQRDSWAVPDGRQGLSPQKPVPTGAAAILACRVAVRLRHARSSMTLRPVPAVRGHPSCLRDIFT